MTEKGEAGMNDKKEKRVSRGGAENAELGEWKEYTLGNITSKIGSGATPTGGGNAYKSEGISLIRSQNVLDFSFSEDGLALIDDLQADELRNVAVIENDILINITGESVTRCCIVPKKYLPARVNQHVSIVRPSPKLADYRFVYYYFHSIKPELHSMAEIGCTRRALTKGMLDQLDILLPPLPEQKVIAGVLSSLDDKIDLLHRQNKTLEATAEALFRQWFVEEADEGWREGKLGDVIELYYGKGLKTEERTGSGYPVVGSSGIVDHHAEFLVEGPGIVIGRKGTLGKVIYLWDNFYPIDTTYYVKSKVKSVGLLYEYFLIKTINFEDMNTDSAVPGLNRDIALSTEINIAPEDKLHSFNDLIAPFVDKLEKNQIQIRTLEKLRDTLLPKLMSGEVRVGI